MTLREGERERKKERGFDMFYSNQSRQAVMRWNVGKQKLKIRQIHFPQNQGFGKKKNTTRNLPT